MTLKRLVAGLAHAVALSCLSIGLAHAQCKRVVISANPDHPPYHWAEGDRIAGASIALTGRILTNWAWPGRPGTSALGRACSSRRSTGRSTSSSASSPRPNGKPYLAFTPSPAFPNPMALFTPRRKPSKFDTYSDPWASVVVAPHWWRSLWRSL